MNEEKKKGYLTDKLNDYRSRIIASALASVIILVSALFASYIIFNSNDHEKPIIKPETSQTDSSPSVDESSIIDESPTDESDEDNSIVDISIDNSTIDESQFVSEDSSLIDTSSNISEESTNDESDDETIEIIYGETYNNIYVYGDTAVTLLGGSSSNEDKFAEAINNFKTKLGESINLYTAIVPTYVDFYVNGEGKRITTAHQNEIINNIYSKIDDSVFKVDIYSTIADHINEYLYYRLDPNWTPLAAYYGYKQIAKSMGLTPVELDEYEIGFIEEYAGENYRNVKLPQLLQNPDSITFYKIDKLFSATVNHYYTDGTKREDTQMVYSSVSNPLSYGYMIYGDRGYYSNAFTQQKNGKKLLVLKDDSGISLAPFFMAHFEEIHVADIRYFKSYSGYTLDSFLNENDITDVLVLCYTSNARSSYRINNILEFIEEAGAEQEWVF